LAEYFSDPWVVVPSVLAVISILVNIIMFVSNRKEKSKDKNIDLSNKIASLETKVDNIEIPFRIIQNELLIKGMRSTYDSQPDKMLKKIGVD
jgi:hypothetical protein